MMDNMDYGFHEDSLIYSEHPDPAWARKNWISLDGAWKIEHRGVESEIRVPFPVGSEASGVDFRDSGIFNYSREFILQEHEPDRRFILRIGASDYETTVIVNDRELGRHVGGYASFSFDISEAVRAGKNRLELRVSDSHSPWQVRGKQTFMRDEFFVWYPGTAGIWQSVWIEETGPRHLVKCGTRMDFRARRVEIRAEASPGEGADQAGEAGEPWRFSVEVRSTAGGKTSSFSSSAPEVDGAFLLDFGFEDFGAAFWSEVDPNLHAMTLRLSRDEAICDTVESYFGIRDVAVSRDGLSINGTPVFLRMVLVQGYYPGGNYTPLSYRRLEDDIRSIKAMGYNGARIHEKVESPYFQYLCDRLGLMTSFEMPSFYLPSRKAFERYESELRELVARDSVHPSCVMRMLFNETWGIWGVYGMRSRTRRFVLAMYELAKKLDPTRPVIDNSGWEHLRTDIADFHHYLRNASLARETYAGIKAGRAEYLFGFSLKRTFDFYLRNQVATKTRPVYLEEGAKSDDAPLFLSEYGGFGWYDTEKKGSVIENIEEYTRDIVASGLFCGYCYTQLYDVGGEVNGLLGFTREPKIDIDRVRALNVRSASSP